MGPLLQFLSRDLHTEYHSEQSRAKLRRRLGSTIGFVSMANPNHRSEVGCNAFPYSARVTEGWAPETLAKEDTDDSRQ